MDVKVSNTALVIEATTATYCSRLRQRRFLGSISLCLFIFVGWPQALLAGEGELFKPERPELPSPEERRASSPPPRNVEPQSSVVDVDREIKRAQEETLKRIETQRPDIRNIVVMPPTPPPGLMRVPPSTEQGKALAAIAADWLNKQPNEKSKKSLIFVDGVKLITC